MKPSKQSTLGFLLAAFTLAFTSSQLVEAATELPSPPEIWKNFDPDEGDFKEEIVSEKTEDGVYRRDSYISAYVNGEEIRVYCKYAVKAGATNAPGLMDVHGWMGAPRPDQGYVADGWAVMAHDYCGKAHNRSEFTKYPKSLQHGNMDRAEGPPVWGHKPPNRTPIADFTESSDYMWYAIQRRVLSYLLAQKEVDSSRIGAKGFSYGGTIMWNLAMDKRVKAVVAYFGIGWNNFYRDQRVWKFNNPYREPEMDAGYKIYVPTMAPQSHCPHITAATLWLNGSNDHHGGHERADQSFAMFKPGVPWDFAVQARGHHNTEKLGDDCKIWLEKHVLGTEHFWPARPQSKLVLGEDGVTRIYLKPSDPKRIKNLQIYQCLKTANNIERFWRDVEAERRGDVWVAKLPVMNVDDYVFSYANITYDNNCVVSSDFEAVIPSSLGKAIATEKKVAVMPGGADRWKHAAPAEGVGGISGFRPINNRHGTDSSQFGDPKFKAPSGANLKFQFYCTQPQTLTMSANRHFSKEIEITASDDWQSMTIEASQLQHSAGFSLDDWAKVNSIGFNAVQGSDITKVVFANFEWIEGSKKSVKPRVPKAAVPQTQGSLEVGADGKAYLTKEAASSIESFLKVTNDKAMLGTEITISGKAYSRGLGVHARSKISYALDGKFSKFFTIPGPDDAHNGQLEMKILVDGEEKFSTGVVSSRTYNAKPVELSVTGAKELTLIVTEGGNGPGGDHASWAEAYLVK